MPCDQQQSGQVKPPARWPKEIRYLRSYQFHDSVTPAIRDFIRGNSSIGGQLPNTFRNCVAIRPIVDPTHPAHGQYGLFATSRIQPHTRILDYIGTSHLSPRYIGYVVLISSTLQEKYIVMIALNLTMTSPFTGSRMVLV